MNSPGVFFSKVAASLSFAFAPRGTAAFGHSGSGHRLRGLLRHKIGIGLFDFSLVGGTGNGFDKPAGNDIGFSKSEKAPLAGAGLEIDFQSEFDGIVLGAHLIPLRDRH